MKKTKIKARIWWANPYCVADKGGPLDPILRRTQTLPHLAPFFILPASKEAVEEMQRMLDEAIHETRTPSHPLNSANAAAACLRAIGLTSPKAKKEPQK